MPSASSYLLHVLCFAETQYQMESNGIKMDGDLFWNTYDFWKVKSTRDDARGGHEAGGAPDPRGHPVRQWVPFFRRKKANIQIKIVSKNSIQ